MSGWIEPLLSNAIVATLLALGVGIVALFRPRPAVMHALWLIVLLKFITPPLFRFDLLSDDILTTPHASTREQAEPVSLSWIRDGDSNGQLVEATTPDRLFGRASLETNPSARSSHPLELDHWDVVPAEKPELPMYATNGRQSQDARRPRTIPVEAVRQLERWLQAWLPSWVPLALMATWAAGSGAWVLLAIARFAQFRRHLGRTRPASDGLSAGN